MTTFVEKMQAHLLANPHSSTSSAPNISHTIVEGTRNQALSLFKADPEYFEIVFVANATAGIKLVLEAFSGNPEGFDYRYHQDCHTSLVGIRELAHRSHCIQSDHEVEQWLNGTQEKGYGEGSERLNLFAYPAQSNMNGRRLPLSWCSKVRSSFSTNTYSLLDVAALVATSPLDLSDHANAPDFTVLSFYKIFGFPDLGALIVRKASGHVFEHRRYFGGGTTEMITCSNRPWFARKEKRLCDRLEDGTGATHSILALSCAINVHKSLHGGLREVSKHARWLAQCLYEQLSTMKHANGRLVCRMYKDPSSSYADGRTQGPTVAFNIRTSDGTWIGSSKVGSLAAQKRIHVRTGSLCNPAGMAQALGLTTADIQRAFDSGFRCGQDNDVRNGIPMGMVRVSFGAMSVFRDVEVFVRFMEEYFLEGGITTRPAISDENLRYSEQSGTISIMKLSRSIKPLKRWGSKLLRMCSPAQHH
jgi:molybdenum cofactor sulfurtransferase